MAPAQSKFEDATKVATKILQHVATFPPPITFERKKNKKKPALSDYKTIELRIDPQDENSETLE